MIVNLIFNSWAARQLANVEIKSTVIIGDSRIMTGLNPAFIDNSVNLAQNSESYFISYHKLKYLLDNYPKINRVVIGFSYPSFSAYLDNIFSNDVATSDVFDRIYSLVEPSDFGEIPFDKEKFRLIKFKNYFVYPHLNHHKFLGGYVKFQPALEEANLESTIKRHYYDDKEINIGVSHFSKLYLDSIIYECKLSNVDLVLVNLPFHKKYLENIPENFVNYYNEVYSELKDSHVTLLDYTDLHFADSCFKDYNHLSFIGADIISKRINDDLNFIKSSYEEN